MVKRMKIFVVFLVFAMFFASIPNLVMAKNNKSILYGKMMGKTAKEVGKPKKLKFKIDFENYDLKFTDIPEDYKYRKAIIWAVENGLIKNEKKKFKPEQIIKMREFCLVLYELRWKYHQKTEERYKERYKELSRWFLPNAITTDMPEARFLLSFGALNPCMYIPTKLDNDARFEGYYYDKNRLVKNYTLYYMAGKPYFYGLVNVPEPDGEKISTDEYRRYMMHSNEYKYYKGLLYEFGLKFSKRYIESMQHFDYCIFSTKSGIALMQGIGLTKFDPSFEELDLSKEVSRGEFFNFLYLMSDFVRKQGNDFIVTKGV